MTFLKVADSKRDYRERGEELAEAIHFIYQKGWAAGTGGNFSAVVSRDPLRLLITPSGVDKGRVRVQEMLTLDAEGMVLSGEGASSAETRLHLAIVAHRKAGAVLHTHSVWNTLLSRFDGPKGESVIEGYEMLKGLQGVKTHKHRESVPILENSQDMDVLSERVVAALERFPSCHGFLLRGHGLYTWGETCFEARRHVEIFEFLFECVMRERLHTAV